MTQPYFCFGEILWDIIGPKKHPGGAPFNVAAMLAQLGRRAAILSAVGRDALGDKILAIAEQKRVDTTYVAHSDAGLPTGTVNAAIDAAGNATYDIVRPVAWDAIAVSDATLDAVGASAALVFGSLAARSEANRATLDRLLATAGPMKCFDVNLRQPFDDLPRVIDLAKRCDVLKLNHHEAFRLSSFVRNAPHTASAETPTLAAIAEACRAIAAAVGVARLCVTMGDAGAAIWCNAAFTHTAAPKVVVKNTIGAGDAFMAGLVVGLTHGVGAQTILGTAVRLGAFVATQDGPTPTLPAELAGDITAILTAKNANERQSS